MKELTGERNAYVVERDWEWGFVRVFGGLNAIFKLKKRRDIVRTFNGMLEKQMKNEKFNNEYTELKRNLKKLDEIAKLEDNWNQRGASKIDGNLIDFYLEKLFEFEQQPEIFPVFDGSLQLEFNDGKNCLEISLKKDLNKVDYYMEKNDRQIINTVKISSLIDIIDKFYQK